MPEAEPLLPIFDGARRARRYLALYLPHLPVERIRRMAPDTPSPFALQTRSRGRELILQADAHAEAAGVAPSMAVSDARALCPALHLIEADPMADQALLRKLAGWAGRYTPLVGLLPPASLGLDITGCAHLFGGEQALLDDAARRLTAMGFTVGAALTDSLGGAHALAQWQASSPQIVPTGELEEALRPCPLGALGLGATQVTRLNALGLRRLGDVLALPRAGLARRFGASLVDRLDRVLGRAPEPLDPLLPEPVLEIRRHLVEPLVTPEALGEALTRMAGDLASALEQAGLGLARGRLVAVRLDGTSQRLGFGAARPLRDPARLARLLLDRVERIAPEPGVETLILAAEHAPVLTHRQNELVRGESDPRAEAEDHLAALLDRLEARLPAGAVIRPFPLPSHLPERAVGHGAALQAPSADWPARPPRPVRLLHRPAPITLLGRAEDDQAAIPAAFRWQGRVHHLIHAEGPERLGGEWWRRPEPTRDYFRVEDRTGRRFWIFRRIEGDGRPSWWLHGFFA